MKIFYGLDRVGEHVIFPKKNMSGGDMKQFLKVMKALSDSNRVKIVKLLQHRSLCVCELTEALGLAQPTVSKHLKALEEAGLVQSIKSEKWVDYFLSDGGETPFAATLLGNLRHWLDNDKEIASMVEMLPNIRREIICGRKIHQDMGRISKMYSDL